jgi:streptomycin 6-kinase
MAPPDFAPWLARWNLTPDGKAFSSPNAWLLPVTCDSGPAILKISYEPEEIAGARTMQWWGGQGAARVWALDHEALLLERLTGSRDLTDMARGPEDDAATAAICDVLARLHVPRAAPRPNTLVPLEEWFSPLAPAAARIGGAYALAAQAAAELFATAEPPVVLHGDMHHGNVLDSERGWLVIDPKGLFGDRGYDHANLFCYPWDCAEAPSRFGRRARIVSALANLALPRLISWVIAYTGVTAACALIDGKDPGRPLQILEIALAERGSL